MSIRKLKIKIKSIAAEQTMIRQEEHKSKRSYRWLKDKQGREAEYQKEVRTFFDLQHHRKFDLRPMQRAGFLAYGYLRGKTYRQVEANTNLSDHIFQDTDGVWKISQLSVLHKALVEAVRLVNKYGDNKVDILDLQKWVWVNGGSKVQVDAVVEKKKPSMVQSLVSMVTGR